MGEQPEDRNAAWRAQIEQAYRSLPSPSTPAYWQALVSPLANGKPLPLEVLALCWRWWGKKYRKAEQDEIFAIILGRLHTRVSEWAKRLARSARGGFEQGFNQDLEQECHLALWKALGESPAFFEVNFFHALTYLEQHVAQQKMEQEGYRVRKGVKQPQRIPAAQISSLDVPFPGSSSSPSAGQSDLNLADVTPDPTGEMAYANVEFLIDFEQVSRELTAEQRALLYILLYEKVPQREIAAKLGVTDRTVRNKIEQLQKQIRAYLYAEPPHDAQSDAHTGADSAEPDIAHARAPRKDISHAE